MPGMDGSGQLYAPLVKCIQGDPEHHYDAIAVAQYPPRLPLNYAQLLPVAAAQMPAGRCVLIAESFSGPLALALAAHFPERVERIVLSCTFVSNPFPWLASLTALLPWMPMLPAPLSAFFGADLLFNEYNSEPNRQLLQRALAPLSSEVLRIRHQAVLACDARALARACRQPILYLQAQDDRVIPPGAATELLSVRPDMQLLKLAGPHCLLQTRAEQAWAAIKAFCA